MLASLDLLASWLRVATWLGGPLATARAWRNPTDMGAHGATDGGDVRQTNGNLCHEAILASVIKHISAMEAAEDVEVSGRSPSVATTEPSGAIRNAEKGARHIHCLDELAVNRGMEIVVRIGHQHTRNGSTADEPAGIAGTCQELINIESVDVLDWDFRVGRKFRIDEIDFHVTWRRDEHVRIWLADRSAHRQVFELARKELVERLVPVPRRIAQIVAGIEVLIGQHIDIRVAGLRRRVVESNPVSNDTLRISGIHQQATSSHPLVSPIKHLRCVLLRRRRHTLESIQKVDGGWILALEVVLFDNVYQTSLGAIGLWQEPEVLFKELDEILGRRADPWVGIRGWWVASVLDNRLEPHDRGLELRGHNWTFQETSQLATQIAPGLREISLRVIIGLLRAMFFGVVDEGLIIAVCAAVKRNVGNTGGHLIVHQFIGNSRASGSSLITESLNRIIQDFGHHFPHMASVRPLGEEI